MNKNKYLQNLRGTFILATTLAILLISCKKTTEHGIHDIDQKPQVSFIHAAADAPELAVYLNKKQLFMPRSFTYNTVIDYRYYKSGTNVLFGSGVKADNAIQAESSITLHKGSAYSVFITGKNGNSIVILEDNRETSGLKKSKIRFVNMSPDAGVLDLAISGKDTPLFSNIAFKAAGDFTEIEPGKMVSIELRENGKTGILAILPKVTIEKGKIYTVWAKGLRNNAPAGANLSIGIMSN